MRPLLHPPALRPGGTVAIVSTSWGGAGLLPARFARAVAALEALGHPVRVMPHATLMAEGRRDWVAGGVAERLADLHAAFADPEVAAVLSAIGGDHSAQPLPGLDLELVAAHPKVFCGYSDTTVLLTAIHQATGLVTCYGPAAIPEFGEVGGPDAEVVAHLRRVTGEARPAGPLPQTSWQAREDRAVTDAEGRPRAREVPEPRVALRPGRATGPLLAACLPSLCQLLGTPWQPETGGRVLVLEPPEPPYSPEEADRDLTHLRNAGLLDGLAALVIGRTAGWDTRGVAQLHAVVLSAAAGGHPILAGVECSHSSPLLTLPNGVRATVAGEDLRALR